MESESTISFGHYEMHGEALVTELVASEFVR